MTEFKDCPECASAVRVDRTLCDCGYSFQTQKVTPRQKRESRSAVAKRLAEGAPLKSDKKPKAEVIAVEDLMMYCRECTVEMVPRLKEVRSSKAVAANTGAKMARTVGVPALVVGAFAVFGTMGLEGGFFPAIGLLGIGIPVLLKTTRTVHVAAAGETHAYCTRCNADLGAID